jgi:hypothetical protein
MGFDFNFDPFAGFEQPLFEQNTPTESSLGRILLEQRFITQEKLDEAMKIQSDKGYPLVQVLFEGEFCTLEQLKQALGIRSNNG